MFEQYLQQLSSECAWYQERIEQLLEDYKVQPVGSGYIDMILPLDQATALIHEFARIPVITDCISWWCFCTEESRTTLGCPHGMGGPPNRYGNGWFSECVHYPFFEVAHHFHNTDDNRLDPATLAVQHSQILCHYLENLLPTEPFYRDCLTPGLWLLVPDGWRRQRYLVE